MITIVSEIAVLLLPSVRHMLIYVSSPTAAGNSYVAGCTDATYGDSTCPRKLGFGDQEWVAIHHCATDASGDTEWGGCKNTPANETKLTVLPLSMCDPYCESTTLFVGGSTIAAYAVSPLLSLSPEHCSPDPSSVTTML